MAVKPVRDRRKLNLANGLNALQIARGSLATSGDRRPNHLSRSLIVAPLLFALAACGSASGTTNQSQSSAKTAAVVGAVAIAVDPAHQLGVNLNTPDIWQNTRPFMNLIYGSGWQMQNTAPWGSAEDIPAANIDANGWVKSVPAGYRVIRVLSIPAAGGDVVCRYQGNATLTASGPVSNITSSSGALRFTVAATSPGDQKYVTVAFNVDPANYLKNLDCREANASTTDNIAPEFVSTINGFNLVRFVKWSRAEANPASVTWANRTKPGDGQFTQVDLVPVEYIVEAANKANADPYVNIPWNADNDYITRYATYVRDNLAAGHKVYVEVSNEVWNGAYPVYAQACAEAKSEGLPGADAPGLGCAPERYTERVRQVMTIWTNVFSGQMNRLVRVFAWQHVQPYWSDKLLAYQSTYQYVDALATAPYFGHDAPTWTAGQTLDSIMNTLLPGMIADQVNFGVQQKAVAQKYGLQYMTYEGGQHIVLPNNVALLTQIERDPRMYGIYKQYISSWQSQVGSELTLFALTGNISPFGGWGLSEYANQPLSETPKRRAVQEFLPVTTASTTPTDPGTTTTASTQICPDGTVIALTSSCPAPAPTTQTCPDGSVIPLTSSCPTTTTTTPGSKRKGVGKAGKSALA
jgi:hypothetical protein